MNLPRHHRISVKLAVMSYLGETEIRAGLINLGLCSSTAEIINGPDPLTERVIIVPTSKVIHINIRGTKTKRQWISNMNARKKRLMVGIECKAHAGFLHGTMSIIDQIMQALEQMPARPIVFGAHSRGAAESVIIAAMLTASGKLVEEINLFGCPRALNPEARDLFKKAYGDRTWSWVANNDTVFRVPFKWMGFRHVGLLMYFDHKDRLHIDPPKKTLVKGQFRGRIAGGLFDGARDHNAAKKYKRMVSKLNLEPQDV